MDDCNNIFFLLLTYNNNIKKKIGEDEPSTKIADIEIISSINGKKIKGI
jgi:hypothetical protein